MTALQPKGEISRQIPKSRQRDSKGLFTHEKGTKYYDWLLEFPEIKQYADRSQTIATLRSTMSTFARCLTNKDEATNLIKLCQDGDRRAFRAMVVPKMLALSQADKGHYSIRIGVTFKSFYNFINDLDPKDEGALRWKKGEIPKYMPKRTPSQHIPTPEEIYRMTDIVGATPFMGPRNKAVMLFLFQSGCRSGVLSNLTYGDVAPCLDGYCSHDHPFNGPRGMKLPIYLKITANIDTKIRGYNLPFFWTFLGIEAATALQEYIKFRMRPEPKRNIPHERLVGKGMGSAARYRPIESERRRQVSHSDWRPEDDDILFLSTQSNPINHFSVCDIVNLGADGIGIDRTHIWPHLLRKSFYKVIGKSDVDDNWRHAVMGWSMDGVHKHYYDEVDVYDAGTKYASCDFSRQGHGRIQDKIKAQDERIQELEIREKKLIAQLVPSQGKSFSDEFVDALEDPEFQRRIAKMLGRSNY